MTADRHNSKAGNQPERDLESIRSAWSGLEKTEPPELLDQAVLNQAKRAVEDRPGPGWIPKSNRGLAAFASVAVVVLAITLVVEQQDKAPVPAPAKLDGFRLDLDEADSAGSEAGIPAEMERAAEESPAKSTLRKSVTAVSSSQPEARGAPPEAEPMSDALVPQPEEWVRRLIALKANHDEKLASELAAFRAAYPDYPLPPELED